MGICAVDVLAGELAIIPVQRTGTGGSATLRITHNDGTPAVIGLSSN